MILIIILLANTLSIFIPCMGQSIEDKLFESATMHMMEDNKIFLKNALSKTNTIRFVIKMDNNTDGLDYVKKSNHLSFENDSTSIHTLLEHAGIKLFKVDSSLDTADLLLSVKVKNKLDSSTYYTSGIRKEKRIVKYPKMEYNITIHDLKTDRVIYNLTKNKCICPPYEFKGTDNKYGVVYYNRDEWKYLTSRYDVYETIVRLISSSKGVDILFRCLTEKNTPYLLKSTAESVLESIEDNRISNEMFSLLKKDSIYSDEQKEIICRVILKNDITYFSPLLDFLLTLPKNYSLVKNILQRNFDGVDDEKYNIELCSYLRNFKRNQQNQHTDLYYIEEDKLMVIKNIYHMVFKILFQRNRTLALNLFNECMPDNPNHLYIGIGEFNYYYIICPSNPKVEKAVVSY